MEAAPLTTAHAHASKAVHQLTLRNYKLASDEYREAAEDFGKAVTNTEDPEAMRTLHLLQNHHSMLSSKLLRVSQQTPPATPSFQSEIPGRPKSPDLNRADSMHSPPASPAPLKTTTDEESGKVNMMLQPPTPTTPSQNDNPSHPTGTPKVKPPPIPLPSPTAQQQILTLPSRDFVLPSPNPYALAEGLQNARGIRSPQRGRSPADRNLLQVHDPEPGARRGSGSNNGTFRSTSPVTLNAVPKKKRGSSAGKGISPVVGPRDKLPFQNMLEPQDEERGRREERKPLTLSPLASESSPIRPSAVEFDSMARSPSPRSVPETSSPDAFNKFYSQLEDLIKTVGNPLAFAGLPLTDQTTEVTDPDLKRALAERAKAATESFYVVPPTGGTSTYAGMVSRGEKPASVPNDVEQKSTANLGEKPASAKTREELELENQQLRQMSDSLARQLHVWESTAKQNADRMRESLRLFKETNHSSPLDAPATVRGPRFGGTKPRDLPLRAMEASSSPDHNNNASSAAALAAVTDELAKLKVTHEKTVKENDKLRSVVAKYKERWEKLKEGARSRRAVSPDPSTISASTTTTVASTTTTREGLRQP